MKTARIVQVSTWMGDRLVVLFLLIWDRISYERSEALPLHKLYACVSSNSLSDSSETTSQYFLVLIHSCPNLVVDSILKHYYEVEVL